MAKKKSAKATKKGTRKIKVHFQDQVVELDRSLTDAQIREQMAQLYPGVKSAKVVKGAKGQIEFVRVMGTKG